MRFWMVFGASLIQKTCVERIWPLILPKTFSMKMRLFVFVAAVGVAACSPSRKFEDVSARFPNVEIAEAAKNDPYGPCEPSICISPTDSKKAVAGAILDRFYWTSDGGKSWSAGKLQSKYGVFGDPVIGADKEGNFFYMHLSDSLHKGWQDERLLDRIVIQKSTDGGRSWENGSHVGLAHPKDQDKPWLAIDPKTDRIAVTWTEFDHYSSRKPEDRSRILFSMSEDHGQTWSKPLKINELDGDCLDDDQTVEGAVPAFGPNGELYVAWSNDQKIWFDRSLDGGKTWLAKDRLVADQPGGWTFEVPGITRCNGMPVTVCDLSLGPNRGAVYVNWCDQRNGEDNTDVFVAKSTDGGETWSKPLKINSDRRKRHQFFTWLAIDQTTGWLYAVFYDRREHKDKMTDVALAVSKDGGKTWKNMKISSSPFEPQSWVFFGDYSNISAQNGSVRPIWTHLENGKLSIRTALIEMK